MIRSSSALRTLAAILVVLALAVRIAIPSGWMPSGDKAFALTVCTGMDVQTVWLDKAGKLHKQDPSKGKSLEHKPCAFAGGLAANDLPAHDFHVALPPVATAVSVFGESEVAVGTGLAAPPPPAIGPPSYI